MRVERNGNTITLFDLSESEMEVVEYDIQFLEYMEKKDKKGLPDWIKKLLESEED